MVKYNKYQKRKRAAKPKSSYKRLYRMIKNVAQKNKPELKCVDRVTYFPEGSFIYPNSNWAFVGISGCAQGTTFENRLGIQIVGRSIQIKGLLKAGTTQTDSQDVKIIILRDTQGNGIVPTATDVFKYDSFYSPVSLDLIPQRYKILASKTYSVLPSTVGDSIKSVDININLRKTRMYYTGNSNAVSDTRKNSLFIGFVAAKTETTNSNYPRFNWMSRLRFFDE